MISHGRKKALLLSRVPCTDGSRKKWKEQCFRCKDTYYIGEGYRAITLKGLPSKKVTKCLVVHHINEVPNVFDPKFMIDLYCEGSDDPQDGYQVLCQKCHIETHRELEEIKNASTKDKP